MSEQPVGEVCQWCHDEPGDAIPGVAICEGCLGRYEIPPRMISGQLDKPVVVTDGGSVEFNRPDPEDDPFSCSICGQPLGTVKRVEGEEYCDGCLREAGIDV